MFKHDPVQVSTGPVHAGYPTPNLFEPDLIDENRQSVLK